MVNFEWDEAKNLANQEKHGISFDEEQYAFFDRNRIIVEDNEHSKNEERFFCFGKVGAHIITVRFTYRNNKIRIFGAGRWREGKKRYEKENTKNTLH